MKTYIKHLDYIVKLILIISILIPIILLLIYPDARQLPLSVEKGQVLIDEFYYMDGEEKIDITLPESIPTEEGISTIYRKVPAEISDNEYILVWSSQKNLTILLDDELLYSYRAENFPTFLKLSGFHYHLIPIPQNSVDKTLEIRMEFRTLDSGYTTFREVYYGTQAGILNTLVQSYGLYFVFSLAIFFSSILLMILSLALRKFFGQNHAMFYLGLFTFLLSIWFIEQSRLQQFFVSEPMLQAFLVYGTLLLMPIPIARFLGEISNKKDDTGIQVIQLISVVMWLIFMLLQVFGFADLTLSNYPATALLIIVGLYIVYFIFREIQNGNKELQSYLTAFAWFVGFMIAEFIYKIAVDNTPSFFIQVGLLLFIYFISVNLFHKALHQLEIANEATYYQKLALQDLSTGTYNRTAYYTFTEQFKTDDVTEIPYCILVFDLNNLKETNDKFGHREGDKLILEFARCLKQVFEPTGSVYRVGGDEFVVLSSELTKEELEAVMEKMESISKEYKLENGSLSYAYGYSFFMAKKGSDFHIAMHEADGKMYEMKIKMKR